MRNMFEQQLSLPGFERSRALDFVFFALLLGDENASEIVRLRERLLLQHGLTGQLISPELLHVSLHSVGEFHGLSRAAVRSAKEAAAAVSISPFEIVFDRAMSFASKDGKRAFVLRAGADVALMTFHRTLGIEMKKAGIGRRVTSRFTPHMTLLYGDRMMAERSIDAVRWTVRDFVLVQSLRGRGRSEYIHLARWQLRG